MQFVWSRGKHTRNVRNNVSRRSELWRMKMWQCQRRGVVFTHYSAWCSLSSLFIFYGMVTTQDPVIYTRGMVDDTKQIRKSCNVRRLFHWHGRRHETNKEIIYGSTVIYAVYYRGMNDNTTHIWKHCNLHRSLIGMDDNIRKHCNLRPSLIVA